MILPDAVLEVTGIKFIFGVIEIYFLVWYGHLFYLCVLTWIDQCDCQWEAFSARSRRVCENYDIADSHAGHLADK